jgi:hypothetical protein
MQIGKFDMATGLAGSPVPSLDVGFAPDVGSQVVVFSAGGKELAILQGHIDASGGSFLGLVDLGDGTANPMVIGNPQEEAGLKSAAIYISGTTTAVVAGYPSAVIDGVACGKVLVYPVNPSTGIDGTAIETLHDAQPEDGQTFGRTVEVVEFNGQPILVAGANNEVFAYFRTAMLYATDVRQGR